MVNILGKIIFLGNIIFLGKIAVNIILFYNF
jgi:hypothetical protein